METKSKKSENSYPLKGILKSLIIVLISGLLYLFDIQCVNSRPYQYSIGIRIGEPQALSGKTFFGKYMGIEGNLGRGVMYHTRKSSEEILTVSDYHTAVFAGVSVLFHTPVGKYGLHFYGGAGLTGDFGRNFLLMGLNGAWGLEYVLSVLPVCIFADFTPAYIFTHDADALNTNVDTRGEYTIFIPRGGFGIRYYLGY